MNAFSPAAGRLVRSALFWLGLQALGVLVLLAASGGLRSELGPDTPGFRWNLSSGDFPYFLTSKRTFGYPVFLSLMETVLSLEAVATVQLLIYLGSVLFLGWAARVFLGSNLLAVAAASPLFYFELLPWLARQVTSDLLGAAWAITTCACFLRLHAPLPSQRAVWAWRSGLGLAVFLCYQTRPSYLFLVPLLPLVSFGLTTWRQRKLGLALRCASPLALLTLLPLLGWCLLRWQVVGEFGLVSFGGMNVIGITAPMVSPEVVPRLPEEFQPFARKLIRQQQRYGLAPLEPEVSYRRWRNEFNTYAHHVSADALLRTVGGKPGTRKAPWTWANRFYSRFSLAMIRARPDLYGCWLRGAAFETWWWITTERTLAAGTLLLILGGLAALVRRLRGGMARLPLRGLELLILALGWALAGQALVIAVEVPLARYNFANFLFLPGAMLVLALALVRPLEPSR